MYVPDVEFHETSTLIEAASLMKKYAPHARLLAGGTDLLVDLKTGRDSAEHVVSINRLQELRGIEPTDTGIRIGATTTISQLGRSPIIAERFAPILDAAHKMAVRQIRNMATVGGNLASAVPCADLPPILMVLGASVSLWSPDGERTLPLDEFFVGVRKTACKTGELIAAVLVPDMPDRFGAAYARFGLREGNAIAVAAVAAGLQLDDNDVITDAQVVLGAVAPLPKPAIAASEALIGRPANQVTFEQAAMIAVTEASPIADVRGSADFRRELVGVLTRRALTTALDRAKEVSA